MKLDLQRRRHLALLFTFAVFLGPAVNAEPSLAHLFPVAAQQGTTTTVSVAGKFDPWPPQVWVDAPGIIFTATPITGVFNLEIAPEAKPGPHLLRLFNEQGASAPRSFIVSRDLELREAEPNDHFQLPQKIAALPSTLSGRLDKAGDVDGFAVRLQRGQTLIARLEAFVLAAAFDGLLRILDTDGTVLAFNHDGRTLDPFLAWQAPREDTFIVQVMGFAHPASSSVQLAGGEGCVYRLHLAGGPFVRATFPLVVEQGKTTRVQLLGWNLSTTEVEVDGAQCAAPATHAVLPLPGTTVEQTVALSDVREAQEQEPNGTRAEAMQLQIPGAVSGRIDVARDEDRYAFAAGKQRSYEVRLSGAPAGSPLDAWLKIEDQAGKELARSDDIGDSRDPRLTWSAPADGVFVAAVGEVTQRGGKDFIYRLAVAEAVPSIAGTSAHSAIVALGATAEIKVTIKRANGFKAKLELIARQLPDGVSASSVEVPEKDGDIALKLTAEASAKPGGQPFQLILREVESGAEHLVRHFMAATSEDNGVPQGYSELVLSSTDQLWLTVTLPPAKKEPAK